MQQRLYPYRNGGYPGWHGLCRPALASDPSTSIVHPLRTIMVNARVRHPVDAKRKVCQFAHRCPEICNLICKKINIFPSKNPDVATQPVAVLNKTEEPPPMTSPCKPGVHSDQRISHSATRLGLWPVRTTADQICDRRQLGHRGWKQLTKAAAPEHDLCDRYRRVLWPIWIDSYQLRTIGLDVG